MANTTIGSIVAKLMLNIDNFSSNLSKVQSDIEQTGKKLEGLGKLGGGLTSVGKTMTKSLTVPILGIGTAAVATATNFEYSMSQVQAISGATGDEFKALEDEAIKLGGSTKFSAGEVADAMTEMAKAGWSTEQILAGMSGVLDAAAASGESLANVSTIVADAITGFGLEAADATKVADLLTQAANSGTIDINDLGESFKYVAPVAQSLGINIEDATTALSAMSMAGIKGSQAGTALRTMLTNMVKPTDVMAEAMDELGFSVLDDAGNMKSLDTIVADLRTSFAGLTDAEKAKYAATLAGKEGMSGMLALLNLTQEEYDAISESMYNSNGVAKETAEVMQDNLKSALEQLGGAFESLGIRIGQVLIPAIKSIAEKITVLAEKLAGASEEQIKMGIKIAALVAAIGPLIAIVGKMITAFTTLRKIATAVKSGFTIVKTAIAGVSAPVLAIVAVIAVLVAAFVNLWKTNEEFRNKITSIWNGIVGKFKNFFAQITEKINSLGFNFSNFSEVLKAIWKGLCDFLGPIFIGVFETISTVVGTALDVILGVVGIFTSAMKGDWEGVWDSVKQIFESVWEGIVEWFENIGEMFIGIFEVICGWFGTTWEETWGGIRDFFTNIWNGIVSFFTSIGSTIMGLLSPLLTQISGAFQMAWDVIKLAWSYVVPFFNAIWEGIKAIFSVVSTWFETIFSVAWELIKAIWDVVVSYFEVIWEGIKATFSVVGTWFKGIFGIAWEAIKAIWNNVINFFAMIWAGIKAVFAVVKGVLSGNFKDAWEAIKNLWDTVKGYFSGVWEGVKGVFSAVVSFFTSTFSSAWEGVKGVFSQFGSFFSGLWDTISSTFTTLGTKIGSAIGDSVKAGINGVIGMIESTINGIIGLINGAINVINNVPGVSIGKVSELSFPRLAKGGIIDRPTFAEIGEDGREAVVPLEKNLGWLSRLAKMLADNLRGQLVSLYNSLSTGNLQAAMAGAYGSIANGTNPVRFDDSASGIRDANSGSSIYIERIEVRDDDDIEELTQGLYNHNDKSLRAMGRRNL